MPAAQGTTSKETIRRLHDAVEGGVELISRTIDEICAPDVLFHAPPTTADATGTPALKQVWPMLLRAFPDLKVTVNDLIEEGDKVVSRNTVTGIHQGEYMGLAPTGRSITYNEIFICRFVNGRIAEIWGVVDVFSQMKQLGLIPPNQVGPTARTRTRSPSATGQCPRRAAPRRWIEQSSDSTDLESGPGSLGESFQLFRTP